MVHVPKEYALTAAVFCWRFLCNYCILGFDSDAVPSNSPTKSEWSPFWAAAPVAIGALLALTAHMHLKCQSFAPPDSRRALLEKASPENRACWCGPCAICLEPAVPGQEEEADAEQRYQEEGEKQDRQEGADKSEDLLVVLEEKTPSEEEALEKEEEGPALVRASCCGALFHEECVCQWLARSPTCPQCRSGLRCGEGLRPSPEASALTLSAVDAARLAGAAAGFAALGLASRWMTASAVASRALREAQVSERVDDFIAFVAANTAANTH